MGYQRFATPRAYVCSINYNIATSWNNSSGATTVLGEVDIKEDTGSDVTLTSGSKEDLFDLKPHIPVQIDDATEAFHIQYDTEFGVNSLGTNNFIAILNHNFHSAGVIFKVEISDSSDFSSGVTQLIDGDGSGSGSGNNHTSVINAASFAGNDNFIDAANNGWSLITFPSITGINNQYIRVSFTAHNGNTIDGNRDFDTDVYIGGLMFGSYIDWPHPMDVNLTTAYDYDGTTLQNSVGGSTYANSTHYGAPVWTLTNPWVNTTTSNQQTYGFQRRYGRKKHSLNFSHMADTNVFSADQTAHPDFFTGSDLHSQFYNKIIGQHNSFMWTLDKDSTTPGDYGLYRLADSAFQAKQIGSRVWDVKMDLIESW